MRINKIAAGQIIGGGMPQCQTLDDFYFYYFLIQLKILVAFSF